MIMTAVKCIIKIVLILLSWIAYPIIRLKVIGKRRFCPPIRNHLLLCSATELSRRIRRKEIKCEDVISAFIARCNEVNPTVNAIVEDRFENALQEAQNIDIFLQTTTKSEEDIARDTPLLGLPITVKASVAVHGMNYAVGVKIQKNLKAKEDADVIKRIRKAGGIILLTSNTPELCMNWETDNNLIGKTSNPYDTRRTCGGSSGGEAALLGCGASVLSVGSDIAGSVRIPAMFCGVFGHKPSPNWISYDGHKPNSFGEEWSSVFSISPMARYAADLPLLLSIMSRTAEYTESFTKNTLDLQTIKIFYMEEDGSFLTSSIHREMKFAMRNVVKNLEMTQGILVEKTNVRDMKHAFEIASSLLIKLDNVETIFNLGDGTKEWSSVFVTFLKYLCGTSSHTFFPVCHGVIRKIADVLPNAHFKEMRCKKNSLKRQFEELLGKNGVLLYPSFSSFAHYHGEIMYKLCDTSYMMIFNVLGLPVTQCPVGLNKNGLPIGFQIVGNPGCDHLTIAVAREIERVFGGWQQPPSIEKTI